MKYMFAGCTSLSYLDVSSFNTRYVISMKGMFQNLTSIKTLDLSSFDTTYATDMREMFCMSRSPNSLTTIYVGKNWTTDRVTSSDSIKMFNNCPKLQGGEGTTYAYSNPDDKTWARIDGGTQSPGYFTGKTYDVTTDITGKGTVGTGESSTFLVGDIVTLDITAEDGYELTSIGLKDYKSYYLYKNDGIYSFKMPHGDVTVSAVFSPYNYTVSFVANDGEGEMDPQSFTFDEEQALSANEFTFEKGYHFAGWATSPDGDVVYTDEQSVKNLTDRKSVV